MGEDEGGDLKTPIKQKITLLRFYNLPLGIQPLKGPFEGKHTTLYYWILCKKGEWFTFYSKLFFKLAKKGKEDVGKEQKNKAKKGWNKRERRGEREEEKRQSKTREGKNRAAN